MIGRKSVLALSILFAMAVGTASVASASAATAVECSSSASKIDRYGAHCLSVPEGRSANFGHVALSAGSHAITGTNANTASETTAGAVSVLAGSLSGVATEIQCTGVEGTGSIENSGVAVMRATLIYSGCTVTKPAGKGCLVHNQWIFSGNLTGESFGSSEMVIRPVVLEDLAEVAIEKCTVAALNHTFPVTGSLHTTVTGATLTTTEEGVTNQNTLKFGGNKAGLGGALTIKGPNGNGLALT